MVSYRHLLISVIVHVTATVLVLWMPKFSTPEKVPEVMAVEIYRVVPGRPKPPAIEQPKPPPTEPSKPTPPVVEQPPPPPVVEAPPPPPVVEPPKVSKTAVAKLKPKEPEKPKPKPKPKPKKPKVAKLKQNPLPKSKIKKKPKKKPKKIVKKPPVEKKPPPKPVVKKKPVEKVVKKQPPKPQVPDWQKAIAEKYKNTTTKRPKESFPEGAKPTDSGATQEGAFGQPMYGTNSGDFKASPTQVERFFAQIQGMVQDNWTKLPGYISDGTYNVVVSVRVTGQRTLIVEEVIKSSGNSYIDGTVKRAVHKTRDLPPTPRGCKRCVSFELDFRPLIE